MKQLYAIAKFTLKENISNRIFNGILFFGMLVIFTTVVLKEISLYDSAKVIREVGTALIEFFILMMTVYISSTLIIKHKNEKSIYLVLTKPVSKSTYVTGINLGIMATVLINVIMMGVVLFFVLLWQKGETGSAYFYTMMFIFYKLAIITSLGVFFSIVSDSIVTANIFTFSMYIIAHAVLEIKMLADKVENPLYKYLLEGLYYILPNMRVLNFKDYLKSMEPNILKITIYVIGYIAVTIALSNIIFSKKKI